MKAHWLDETDSTAEISAEALSGQGVLCQKLSTDPGEYQGPLDALMAEHSYTEQDEVALTADIPNLDEICAKFVDEHYHDEDEVRFLLDGEGIFDIRSKDDKWMRVEVFAVPTGREPRVTIRRNEEMAVHGVSP